MRYKMIFSYDGSNFSGYQKQPNKRTIQEELESVLSKINNSPVGITASGRTDAHVHAYSQVAHFDFLKKIPVDKLKKAINSMLPSDIYIRDIKEVCPQFHARFDVLKKTYCYKINTGEYNPIMRNYQYQLTQELDLAKLKAASKVLLGTHDFSSFVKLDVPKDCVRTIEEILVEENNGSINLTFTGNGFLRYMVRNLVGSLIEVGLGKKSCEELKFILEAKDRIKAGLCAPAEGLYLVNVCYEENFFEK